MYVAAALDFNNVNHDEEVEANARLIAAAPEPAKALLDLAEMVNDIATEQCEAAVSVEFWNRTTGRGWQAARAAEAAAHEGGNRAMTSHAKSRRLPRGNYSDVCSECAQGTACACQVQRVARYVVELTCGHCARTNRRRGDRPTTCGVLVPRGLRCRWCGGQPQPGEIARQTTYPTLPRLTPRRGRPPRWLVEQRRLERSA